MTMTEYEEGLPVLVAFPPETARSLAQAVSEAGWRQFHVAETEKYAHVTYFFNGGVETRLAGRGAPAHPEPEGRDLRPRSRRCRAAGVTDALVEAIGSGAYDFIVANYANPDMVGHTGDVGRDARGARDASSLPRRGSSRPSTRSRRADPDGPGASWPSPPTTATPTSCATRAASPVTAHSLNPVPFVLVGRAVAGRALARRRPRRCRADPPRARRPARLAGDHRAFAARGAERR